MIKVSLPANFQLANGSTHSDETPPLTCAKFHPDGFLFSTGTSNSIIKLWDITNKGNIKNLLGHTGSITCLAFSENGYFLATAAEDSLIKIWDLRKFENFKTIEFDKKYTVTIKKIFLFLSFYLFEAFNWIDSWDYTHFIKHFKNMLT